MSNADKAKFAFNTLMTTGKRRLHPHIYFGLPIKLIATIATFIDLIASVLPVAFAGSTKYQAVFLLIGFLSKIGSFYVVLVPKSKYLKFYQASLLFAALVSFGVNVLFLFLSLIEPRNGCHKLYMKHSFAVCGVFTPIEILVFIAISAYTSYISEQEESAQNSQPPPSAPPKASKPTDPNTKEKVPQQTLVKTVEVEQRPLMNDQINDLD